MNHRNLVVIFLALAMSATALCQVPTGHNVIRVEGTFVKTGKPLSSEAIAEEKIFAQIAPRFPMKSQAWQWIIVVDEPMWKLLMVRMGFPNDPRTSYYGQTDLQDGVTYIRGYTLLHPDQPDAKAEHVISHEMAHVYLNSADEGLVDRTADAWMLKFGTR
jgi:hypothetical protein